MRILVLFAITTFSVVVRSQARNDSVAPLSIPPSTYWLGYLRTFCSVTDDFVGMELTEDGRLSTLKLEDKQSGFFLRLQQAQEAAPGSSSTKAALSPIRT